MGLGPALVRWGMVTDGSFSSLTTWLLWPGVGLMLGGSVASMARDAGSFRASAADFRSAAGGVLIPRPGSAGLLAVALLLVSSRAGFGLGLAAGALSILPAVLSANRLRAGDRKDGRRRRGRWDRWSRGRGCARVGGGRLHGRRRDPRGVAAQSAVGLWSLRAGSRTGTGPRAQGRALMLGLMAGAVVAVPLYPIVRARVSARPSFRRPPSGGARSPSWRVGRARSRRRGMDPPRGHRDRAPAGGDPPGALGGLVPSPGVVGLGFLVPAHYAVALLAGAVLAALAVRRGRSTRIGSIAAGAESPASRWRRWQRVASRRSAPAVATIAEPASSRRAHRRGDLVGEGRAARSAALASRGRPAAPAESPCA